MSDLDLRDEPYDGPTAQQLIGAVQAEYVVRYGGPDDSPVDPSEFAPPNGLFLIGYLDNTPVAMGGLRRHGAGEVEIKRMYVVPEARGRGLSRVMLAGLEERARRLGASRIVLETGQRQPEAISLYESSGYQRIPGFGHYAEAPLSISFEKKL
ncbi:MAG TPA: GNAT family N-acetyltransferase [Mycobacteriales bacterium]|nr:GNAT family N-acetyltransferase [Mycobacteriales bacterium]